MSSSLSPGGTEEDLIHGGTDMEAVWRRAGGRGLTLWCRLAEVSLLGSPGSAERAGRAQPAPGFCFFVFTAGQRNGAAESDLPAGASHVRVLQSGGSQFPAGRQDPASLQR